MKEININDSMWHPCSMDIIQYTVISIRQFEGFNHYVLQAVRNVGACGKIQVIVSENKGKFRFIELIDEEHIEYARGLGDFVEGYYYSSKDEAELAFYNELLKTVRNSTDHKLRLYQESKSNLDKIELLISELKDKIKNQSDGTR